MNTTPPIPKNVLVAPLNWGLGHATRCIPVIRALEEQGYNPVLASDGVALELLKKEFPHLQALELPSYQIEYPEKASAFLWKMIKNTPKVLAAMQTEKKRTGKWVKQYNLCGIISDNRMGVHSKSVPSVFITHQLNVLSGRLTWLTGKLHRFYIKKFSECWVPDGPGNPNLSGKLGHCKSEVFKIRYLGPLSRLQRQDLPIVYDIMVLLSGPEPQRTILEGIIREHLSGCPEKVVFIKGLVEEKQTREQLGNTTFYNFMNTPELEKTFNESQMVVCRSGYTTLMDLAKLHKKALLIPTPGQFEQEYLAGKLKNEGLLPMVKQHQFRKDLIYSAVLYPGLPKFENEPDWKALFRLFEGK